MNNSTKTIDEQIVSLRKEGLIQREIAERLPVTKDKVRYVLDKAGLKNFKYKRECLSCKKNYGTIRHSSKFCSEKCRSKYNRNNRGIKQKCIFCGKEFFSYKNKIHCNNKCKEKFYEKKELIKRFVELINPLRHKRCLHCENEFYAGELHKKFCSNACLNNFHYRYKPKTYQHKCRECGSHYTDNQENSAGCSDSCKNKFARRKRELNRYKRLKENGTIDWDINLERLIKRDKGHCHLCNSKVIVNDDYNSDYYPSIDHVIPISKGGTHTWDNVKLAHRICNTYKSNKLEVNKTTLN